MTLDFEPEIERLLLALAHADGVTATEYVTRLIREKPVSPHSDAPAQVSDKNRVSAIGKYAHILGGSEEFAREKQAEIEREDRPRR